MVSEGVVEHEKLKRIRSLLVVMEGHSGVIENRSSQGKLPDFQGRSVVPEVTY